jgi:Tol biopolymer transport system component
MKTRLFLPLFLLVTLTLLVGKTGTSPVVGNTAIANQLPGALLAGTTTRVSVASDGTQGNDGSFDTSISADGRYVAFSSDASNLVPGDTNGVEDVFVHDHQTGQTSRVSVASDGTQGNDGSSGSSISGDGRYVTFFSWANNLVPGDTNGVGDVFVHDRQTGQTSRVSVASDGTQGNEVSYIESISADGRYVTFYSAANNLVPGDTNGVGDVFVHDRQTGQTSRVSVASDGTQGNDVSSGSSISADGRYVAFSSEASNLVPDDTNGATDIFVHDRQTGQTSRVSVASDGTQGNLHSIWPSISADGRYVAFRSQASNLVPGDINICGHPYTTGSCPDVFVHDRQTGQTSRVSVASDGTEGNDASSAPSISADGRYVAFDSAASNLVPGDTNGAWDIFVHDRQTGQTSRVSVASDGTQGNGHSNDAKSISADGRYVTYISIASNLVPGDTNDAADIFVHDRLPPLPSLASNYPDGQPGSFFTITGSNFPPGSLAAVAVNGTLLAEGLPADEAGNLLFLLDTSQADAGRYFVTVTANPAATIVFTLDPAAPLRPQEESGPVFNVPGGIALTQFVYLPLIWR